MPQDRRQTHLLRSSPARQQMGAERSDGEQPVACISRRIASSAARSEVAGLGAMVVLPMPPASCASSGDSAADSAERTEGEDPDDHQLDDDAAPRTGSVTASIPGRSGGRRIRRRLARAPGYRRRYSAGC